MHSLFLDVISVVIEAALAYMKALSQPMEAFPVAFLVALTKELATNIAVNIYTTRGTKVCAFCHLL